MHSQQSRLELALPESTQEHDQVAIGGAGFRLFAHGAQHLEVDIDLSPEELGEPVHRCSLAVMRALAGTERGVGHDADLLHVPTDSLIP
jgi:hypothetical protein